MFYCIYSDRECPDESATDEHVLALSLGGHDSWRIRVERGRNHDLGSELDGGMANDLSVAMRRSKHDARGHSGKEPWAVAKKGWFKNDLPVQVGLSRRHGMRVWSPRDERLLSDKELAGQSIRFTTVKKLDVPLRFVAKTALAAGYFAYGDAFRKHVSHAGFREVLLDSPATQSPALDVTFDEPILCEPPRPKSRVAILRAGCKALEGSIILLIPDHDRFSVAVGVLGEYVGMLSVAADGSQLPNLGDYRWGHVLASTQGFGLRGSFRRFVNKLTENSEPQ